VPRERDSSLAPPGETTGRGDSSASSPIPLGGSALLYQNGSIESDQRPRSRSRPWLPLLGGSGHAPTADGAAREGWDQRARGRSVKHGASSEPAPTSKHPMRTFGDEGGSGRTGCSAPFVADSGARETACRTCPLPMKCSLRPGGCATALGSSRTGASAGSRADSSATKAAEPYPWWPCSLTPRRPPRLRYCFPIRSATLQVAQG
jgi:hypothetical protein